jgi:hypothetical protein
MLHRATEEACHAVWLLRRSLPITGRRTEAMTAHTILTLPLAWLGALINSYLDNWSRWMLFQTNRKLRDLVLSAAPQANLDVNVRTQPPGPSEWLDIVRAEPRLFNDQALRVCFLLQCRWR